MATKTKAHIHDHFAQPTDSGMNNGTFWYYGKK